ncbi:MAG: hypothetical protein Q7R39_09510 [Dehalococcoidia bacterium]|nr:hypothetical protein [Dehalococcoidia bacterium]
MDLTLILLADYANVAEKGKLNVMGIFNQVFASAFPTRHPEMYLIAKLTAYPSEYNTTRKVTIRLVDEDGRDELVNWSQDVHVPQGSGGSKVENNIILKMVDVEFRRAGAYQFSVLVDNDHKGDLRLDVQEQIPNV